MNIKGKRRRNATLFLCRLFNSHCEAPLGAVAISTDTKGKIPPLAPNVIKIRKAPFGKGSCHRTVTEGLYKLIERQRDTLFS